MAVSASVIYVSATFLMYTLGLYEVHFIFNFAKAAAGTNLHYTAHVNFALFGVILLLALLVNVFRSHLVTTLYNVSVWWNIVGVLAIIVLPDRRPVPPRELLLRVRPQGQRIRVRRRSGHGREILALRAAARASC